MNEHGILPDASEDDLREVMITIAPDSTRILATWFARLNARRRHAKVVSGVVTQEEYDRSVFTKLEHKLTEAANAATANGASFEVTYQELDVLILESLGHEKPMGDIDFRARVVSGDSDKGIAFRTQADYLKHPLRECLESFIGAGGNDRFGYLGLFRRIANKKVVRVYDDDCSSELFEAS